MFTPPPKSLFENTMENQFLDFLYMQQIAQIFFRIVIIQDFIRKLLLNSIFDSQKCPNRKTHGNTQFHFHLWLGRDWRLSASSSQGKYTSWDCLGIVNAYFSPSYTFITLILVYLPHEHLSSCLTFLLLLLKSPSLGNISQYSLLSSVCKCCNICCYITGILLIQRSFVCFCFFFIYIYIYIYILNFELHLCCLKYLQYRMVHIETGVKSLFRYIQQKFKDSRSNGQISSS